MIPYLLLRSGGSHGRTVTVCFVIKGNVWWERTFPPMATILALHPERDLPVGYAQA